MEKQNQINNYNYAFKLGICGFFMRIIGLDLERLIRIVEASKIDGLEVKGRLGGFFNRVKIEKPKGAKVISCYLPPPPMPTKKERDMERRKRAYSEIKSPGVGTFYLVDPRNPEAKPYAQKGSKVKNGNVVGLIYHLGLYDEIYAECDGKIVDIYVKDNTPIDYKKPLFKIRNQNKK